MIKLRKRLEIRLDQATFQLLRDRAKQSDQSIGELIRFAIQNTFKPQEKKKRVAAFHKLCHLNLPVSDWPQMEREIEQGYS